MKKIILPAVLLAGLSLGQPAHAQNPAAAQQADTWRLRQLIAPADEPASAAPELFSGETSDVGPQTLLQLKKRRTWVQAFADEQIFYTDNVFLADHARQSANVLVSTVHAALAPTFEALGGQLTPRLGYQHQWFSYALLGGDDVLIARINPPPITFQTTALDQFDFNVQTVFGDVTWSWRGWDFSLGGDYRRYLDSGNYGEFYREMVPRWAVHRTFQLAENKSLIVGYEGDYRFTETQYPFPGNKMDYNDRTDHSFVLAGNWRLCPHAIVQPFYRLQYSTFTQSRAPRADWLNSFGIALHFPITRNIALRTFVSYDTLNTDGVFVLSYDQLNAGGGLNLSVQF